MLTTSTLHLSDEIPISEEVVEEASHGSRRVATSLLGGIFNLLNTVIGAGILSLPYAFQSSRVGVGIAYQLVFGGASWFGSWLLLDALKKRPRCQSYEELALVSLGYRGALAYNCATLINCYGACISYLIVVADIVPPLLNEMGYTISRSAGLVFLTAVIIFPLASMRDMSALQFSSGLAIAIYLAFVLALVSLANDVDASSSLEIPMLNADVGGWIRAIPLCAFAYVHQTSLFPIIQETRDPSPPRR